MKSKLILALSAILISPTSSAQNCDPGQSEAELNINNIKAGLRTAGDLWRGDLDQGGYIAPNQDPIGPEVSALYIGGLW